MYDRPIHNGWYACVLAELGRFDEALQELDKAEAMNPSEKLQAEINTWRSLFKDKKPYRHAPKD
jgi:tetratricopeptide (TPR) repeat protein